MNDLQHIPESRYGPVLVTLNPPFEPHEDTVVGRWQYEHPVIDSNVRTYYWTRRSRPIADLMMSTLRL